MIVKGEGGGGRDFFSLHFLGLLLNVFLNHLRRRVAPLRDGGLGLITWWLCIGTFEDKIDTLPTLLLLAKCPPRGEGGH